MMEGQVEFVILLKKMVEVSKAANQMKEDRHVQ